MSFRHIRDLGLSRRQDIKKPCNYSVSVATRLNFGSLCFVSYASVTSGRQLQLQCQPDVYRVVIGQLWSDKLVDRDFVEK